MTGTVADWSTTASANTSINGIDIAEGCSPAGINNAIREVIAEGKAKFNTIDSVLATGTVAAAVGTRTYATQAALYADLVPAAGLLALVYADPTPAKNDIYVKSGATGTGSWSAPLGIFAGVAKAYADAAAVSAASAAAAAIDAAGGAQAGTLQLRNRLAAEGITGHFYPAVPSQLLKADLSPVTAAGDAVAYWVPAGETYGGTFTCIAGGTYQVDENGVGYVLMVEGLNYAQSTGTFNLTPNTWMGVAMARQTDSNSDGLYIINGAGTASINIGFTVGSSQLNVVSSRSGDFPRLNSRNAVAPLQMPVVQDFLLEAGSQSSWTNNSVRDTPDASPLLAGLRKMANTWTGADSFATSHLQVNFPTKGGIRVYGFAAAPGVSGKSISLLMRRRLNNWLMDLTTLRDLKENSYDIFPIIGDSIAMGVGDQLTSTAVPFGNAAEYIDTGALIPLKDPIQGMWPDQFAASGSFAPAFGKTWYDLTGTACCIVGCGNGTGVGLFAGSGFYAGGWLGSNLMPIAARKVRSAMADVRGRVRGVLAYVGTNDRTLGKTQAQLVAGFVALRDKCRTAFDIADLPLLLISADTSSVTGDEALFSVVRAAQVAAAYPNNEGIYLVVPYQNYLASGHHAAPTGNVHLDQFANNAIGVLAATNTAPIIAGLP